MTATRSARPAIAVGLHALGIANSSKPEVLATVARRADEAGFGTLWCGEHVVMVDEPGSRYRYSHDGKITVPDGCSPPLDPARARPAGWPASSPRRTRISVK